MTCSCFSHLSPHHHHHHHNHIIIDIFLREGCSPLFIACKRGNVEIVEYLMSLCNAGMLLLSQSISGRASLLMLLSWPSTISSSRPWTAGLVWGSGRQVRISASTILYNWYLSSGIWYLLISNNYLFKWYPKVCSQCDATVVCQCCWQVQGGRRSCQVSSLIVSLLPLIPLSNVGRLMTRFLSMSSILSLCCHQ